MGVLITRGDRMLLMRRANVHGAGTWSTPGGHLDFGERPDECARREALEETGLVIAEPRFVGITNDVFDDTRHYITLWFEAECDDGEPQIAAPYELSELGWFHRAELPSPLFAPLQRLLDGEVFRG